MEKMSWLSKLNPRASSATHRASRGSSLQNPVWADPETCLMVFKNHWAQVLRILEKPSSSSSSSSRGTLGTADDLSAVRNNTYQMMTLLVEEQPRGEGGSAMGPILEFVVSEEVLGRLLAWHLALGVPEERQAELLKLFETLVSQARQPLLRHKPLVAPLQRLLAQCAAGAVGGSATPHLEGCLVLLLHQLCVSVAKEPPLLELFFHNPPQGPPELLIFSLLVPFVHHEGGVGQQARDALLLLMAMSSGSPTLARYVTEHSYFCPVLATGLSALYSSLPRKLEVHGDDWHFLRREDWIGVASLALFINSLEFCNAVVQVAHPLVQKQLVGYVHNGFLVPVMGPALHKSSIEEMIASTAYLELFLRSLSEAPPLLLLKTFLCFLLLHRHDGSTILDTLVGRIASNSRLCMVSLSLFRTLLSLHCEDVLLQLVLRYLVPCSHVMLSQKRAVKEVDLYGKAAGKFLSLVPQCCRHCPEGLTPRGTPPEHQEEEQQHAAWSKGHGSPNVDTSSVVTVPRPSTPSRLSFFMRQPSFSAEASSPTHRSPGTPPAGSPCHLASQGEELSELEGNYLEYLRDARLNVDRCVWACRVWSAPYDGELPGVISLASTPDPPSSLPGSKDPRLAPPSPRTKKRGLPAEEEEETSPAGGPALDLEAGPHTSPGPTDSGALFNGALADSGGVKKVRRCKGPGEGVENGTVPAASSPPADWRSSPCSDPLLEDLLAQATVENGEVTAVERFAVELSRLEREIENGGGGGEGATSKRDPCSGEGEEEEEAEQIFSWPDGTGQARPFADPLTQVIRSPPRPPGQPPSQPFTGPFVGVLLAKLENMPQNSLYVNLLLTGLLAHLACHPQPLLRSFLLNTNMVFQPSVKSLLQVLGSVKNKIESFADSQEDFPALLFRAKKYLIARAKMVDGSEVQNAAAMALRRSENLVKSRKPSLGELILRHTNSPTRARQAAQLALQHMREGPVLQALSGGGPGSSSSLFFRGGSSSPPSSTKSQNEALRVKNAVYCAVIFTEFLKELAAIAQAQAVTSPFLLLPEGPPEE